MSKRMTIQRYIPPAPAEPPDGLEPMLQLPTPDGQVSYMFLGRRSHMDGYIPASLIAFAKKYARTCCAALDIEIDVLKTERDALKTALDELRGHGSR